MSDSILFIFLITAGISFAGSLQLGIVNTEVIKAALYKNKKAAQLTALGGSLPEIIYAALAVYAFSILQHQSHLLKILQYLISPILLVFGLYFLLKKQAPSPEIKNVNYKSSFLKGFVFGCINPQLLPFWFGILVYLDGFFFTPLKTMSGKFAFIIATGFGAFVLLYLVSISVAHKKEFFLKYMGKATIDQALGWIFIGMAIIKFIQLF